MRIHDNTYLRAARRLYMTATPRIYAEAVKDKADQHSAELVSMDDELRYGPEPLDLVFVNPTSWAFDLSRSISVQFVTCGFRFGALTASTQPQRLDCFSDGLRLGPKE